MSKARCEAVAAQKNGGVKVGEEVRFYQDGECVETLHLTEPAQWGTFEEGKDYEKAEVDKFLAFRATGFAVKAPEPPARAARADRQSEAPHK